MKILYLSSEVQGLLKTGGLADVSRALPAELVNKGHDIRIVMPCYRSLLEKDFPVVLPTLIVPMTPTENEYCTVRVTEISGVTVYLLEHHKYFSRHGVYDDGVTGYIDNGQRFAFLSKAGLELAKAIGFQPDILHTSDWQTGLAAYYLRAHYGYTDYFAKTASVHTVHNGSYQGQTSGALWYQLGLTEDLMRPEMLEDYGQINLLKAGIRFADKVNAVSPGYRDELLDIPTSHGLNQMYYSRGEDFVGLLNGCDYGEWNPETDPHIAQNYSADDLAGKAACKMALQKELGLTVSDQIPMFANISRLTSQKGYDQLIPALQRIARDGVQIVLLGSGDPHYAHQLEELAHQHPETVRFIYGYSEPLSHKIEAAADYYLMPSVFEPCGLNQIYSLRYGAVPIVRRTGGLAGTVVPLNDDESNLQQATGLHVISTHPDELTQLIERAIWIWYHSKASFLALQQNGMAARFTWDQAANDYLALYQSALDARRTT
ncbi:glycogen synthase [Salinibius halmophilus]|uniref:glycogen synthase n=1 Tax=Salinibius halmophilus TaxID=1853216 RepID=UPI000E671546|nr:glycogen synthase [Salinibius halmophilus]